MKIRKPNLHIADLRPSRPSRPRQRQPLNNMVPAEQSFILELAKQVQLTLQDAQQHEGFLDLKRIRMASKQLGLRSHQFVGYIKQALVYRDRYPDTPIEEAFTPPIPGQTSSIRRSVQTTSAQDETAIVEGGTIKPIKRPHILSIQDPIVREERIRYANIIAGLITLRKECGKQLSKGSLEAAAVELGKTVQWINKQMRFLELYRAAYGHETDYNDANAFVELPRHRRKGRTTSQEIRDVVRQAILNTEWQVINADGTTAPIQNALNPKLIHSLIKESFEKAPSYTTVWRIIKDLETAEPALFHGLRTDVANTRNILPSITIRSRGVMHMWLLDIRPAPYLMMYQGIVCTSRIVLIIDHFSGRRLMWYVLPAKRLDTNQEIVGQDFTCQKIRELLMIAMQRFNGRPHIIYVDNGSQFSEPALRNYLMFLTAPGEEPTQLINREVERPRGGGAVEQTLKHFDNLVKHKPGYIDERNYRQSLKRNKRVKLMLYEQFSSDFDVFMNRTNKENESIKERFENGRWLGLSLPSPENLAMFAFAIEYVERRPNPDGIHVNGKLYVPKRKDATLYSALADANQRARQDSGYLIPVRIIKIAEERIVLFSLDDQRSWEYAIEKDQDPVASRDHSQLLRAIEVVQRQKGNEAAAFMKVFLSDRDQPLILNPLHDKPQFEPLAKAQQELRDDQQHASFEVMPTLSSEISTAQAAPQATPSKTSKRRRSSRPDLPQAALAESTDSSPRSEIADDDDLDAFLKELGYTPSS
ncbi:MAG: hypothetical protein H0T53_17415 [Herpetosiphonaceae bacterium]|nr:hypothetical protein [Herpetosiphonaceae bacterium]